MKYIPQRKCVACQRIRPKHEMLRLVKSKENNYTLDSNQKADGRGAYVCNHPDCIAEALKKHSFHRSFKTNVPESCYHKLQQYAEENHHAG